MSVTSCPNRPSAFGRAVATSASPPVFENGWASDAIMRMRRPAGARDGLRRAEADRVGDFPTLRGMPALAYDGSRVWTSISRIARAAARRARTESAGRTAARVGARREPASRSDRGRAPCEEPHHDAVDRDAQRHAVGAPGDRPAAPGVLPDRL